MFASERDRSRVYAFTDISPWSLNLEGEGGPLSPAPGTRLT